MNTDAGRFLEKVMCQALPTSVPGLMTAYPLLNFRPQRGLDTPTGCNEEGTKNTETFPLAVFAVAPDGTEEVLSGSGVYQARCKLILLDDMDDTSAAQHSDILRQLRDALRGMVLPQGWSDPNQPGDVLTLTGIDLDGVPIPVPDGDNQTRCNMLELTVAFSTNPLTLSAEPGP